MQQTTHHAHDKIFKAAFQYRETAIEFVKTFVSKDIIQFINFDDFTLDITDYISGNMKELFSDVVYKTSYKGKELKIAILFEHKQVVTKHIRLQLSDYINAIQKKDVQEDKPLTFVLPIVIYQGKKKWKKQPAYKSFNNLPPLLRPFVPEFDYLLIEIQEIDGKKILSLSDESLLKSLFATYKYAKDETFLRENLNNILQFYVKNNELFAFLQQILIYLFSQSDIKSTIMNDILKHISSPIKSTAMTTYAQIIQEGKREGILEGKREGKIEGKIEEKKERDRKLVIQFYKKGYSVAEMMEFMEILKEKDVKEIVKGLKS